MKAEVFCLVLFCFLFTIRLCTVSFLNRRLFLFCLVVTHRSLDLLIQLSPLSVIRKGQAECYGNWTVLKETGLCLDDREQDIQTGVSGLWQLATRAQLLQS